MPENSAPGYIVGQVNVMDDENDNITIELAGSAEGRFAIETIGGVTSLKVSDTIAKKLKSGTHQCIYLNYCYYSF